MQRSLAIYTLHMYASIARKHKFLIMRLLACPIYGNHFGPRGWKTQDAGKKGKQKLKKDQYCSVKQEV